MATNYLTISVNASASGDNTLQAADATAKWELMAAELVSAGPVSLKFKDGAATDFHAAIPLQGAGSNYWLPESPSLEPYFQGSLNTAFVLNLSAAVAITGWIKLRRKV